MLKCRHFKQWLELLSNKENSGNNNSTHISHEVLKSFLVEVLATKDVTYKQRGHKTMAECEVDNSIFLQLERGLQGGAGSDCCWLVTADHSPRKVSFSHIFPVQHQLQLLSRKMQVLPWPLCIEQVSKPHSQEISRHRATSPRSLFPRCFHFWN